MKALVISMLISLVAFFSNTAAFGQVPDSNKSPQPQITEKKEEPAKILAYKKVGDANKVADVNAAAEVNAVAEANTITDPNAAVRAKVKEFEGLEGSLTKLNSEGKDEINKWMLNKEVKLELVLAVQKQLTDEFKFLRELAIKEGDAKTAAAIDGVLLDRQDRFKEVIDKLEQENEKTRRHAEQEERRKEQQERGTNPNSERAPRVRVPRERPTTNR